MTVGGRWAKLIVSVLAQTGTSFFQFGVPFVLPQLQEAFGASLLQGALLVGAPSVGMVATLLLWGLAADRIGDRPVMTAGLLGAGVALVAIRLTDHLGVLGLLLVVAGGCGASVNVTSGRIVLQAFDARNRGVAMGIRQTSPLLGMSLAALVLPGVSAEVGYANALLAPAVLCLLVAGLAVAVIGPSSLRGAEHPKRVSSPYRDMQLWRLHGASALLVVPQIAVASFAFLYLVTVPDWRNVTAGAACAVALAGGAALRLVAGAWSDRVADRTGPMRAIAICGFGLLASAAATMAVTESALPGVLLLASAAVTAAWNGLAFTAVAETAGSSWAGRALGLQNTVQFVTTAATPPAMAVAIGSERFAVAFFAASLVGLVGVFLVPALAAPQSRAEPRPSDDRLDLGCPT